MIVAPDFLDHWKTQMLVRRTGDKAAPLMILRLWGHCQHRRKWRFVHMSGEALASICHSEMNGDDLKTILTDCGFVSGKNGTLTIHEWADFNRALINSWNNGSKGGRPKKPTGNPEITHGLPTANPPLLILSSLISSLEEGVRGRFQEWIKVRKARGKKPGDWEAFFACQIKWLQEFAPKDQTAIIDQSIRNGWQGLFPIKREITGQKPKTGPDPDELTGRNRYTKEKYE